MKISMNNRMYREYSKITEINYYAKIDFNFSIFIGYNVVLLSDKKTISEDSVNRGIRFLGGKTQYEIENNEIYINNYAKNNDILEIIKAGFIIARKLESEFHKLNKNNICIIMSIDSNNNGNLTFHEIVNGNLWIDENLENYEECIAIFIVWIVETVKLMYT